MDRARRVDLTPRYLSRARTLGVHGGTEVSRDVGRLVRQLAQAEHLPMPGDVEALMPPVVRALVRRVPGRNLWIWSVAIVNGLTTPVEDPARSVETGNDSSRASF